MPIILPHDQWQPNRVYLQKVESSSDKPSVSHTIQTNNYGTKKEPISNNCAIAALTTLLNTIGYDWSSETTIQSFQDFLRKIKEKGSFGVDLQEIKKLQRHLPFDQKAFSKIIRAIEDKNPKPAFIAESQGLKIYGAKNSYMITSAGMAAYLANLGLEPEIHPLNTKYSFSKISTALDEGKSLLILDQDNFPFGHFYVLTKHNEKTWVSFPHKTDWVNLSSFENECIINKAIGFNENMESSLAFVIKNPQALTRVRSAT